MTLESTIEARSCLELRRVGALAIKMGMDGWPDRLVVFDGKAVFMEFKRPGLDLGAAQKVRRTALAEHGHPVHIVTSWREALAVVAKHRR